MGKLPPIAPLFRRWGAWLAFSWVALTGGCQLLDLGRAPLASVLGRDSQTLRGGLTVEDKVSRAYGSYWDGIPVVAKAGQILIAALESEEFDPYLELVDEQGRVIGFDDDSGLDVNALLAVRLPQEGTYTLRATSFEPAASGSYRLTYTLTQGNWQQTLSGRLHAKDPFSTRKMAVGWRNTLSLLALAKSWSPP
jgi:hypothetical protein